MPNLDIPCCKSIGNIGTVDDQKKSEFFMDVIYEDSLLRNDITLPEAIISKDDIRSNKISAPLVSIGKINLIVLSTDKEWILLLMRKHLAMSNDRKTFSAKIYIANRFDV